MRLKNGQLLTGIHIERAEEQFGQHKEEHLDAKKEAVPLIVMIFTSKSFFRLRKFCLIVGNKVGVLDEAIIDTVFVPGCLNIKM